jgi:hypothetical protein
MPRIPFPYLKVLLVQLSQCNEVADLLKPLILPWLTRSEVTPPRSGAKPDWDHSSVRSTLSAFGQIESLTTQL